MSLRSVTVAGGSVPKTHGHGVGSQGLDGRPVPSDTGECLVWALLFVKLSTKYPKRSLVCVSKRTVKI
jgi:hypothetical protein